MPTRADIEAATPKCPHRKRSDDPQCGRTLVYSHKHKLWACVVHGDVLTCTELVAVQQFEAQLAYDDAVR